MWNYSVSTDVLGYLVGKISGQPFERFVQERILGPLGMDETGFHVPVAHASRLAACYVADSKGLAKLQDDPTQSPFLTPPSFISGGGGLVSTAGDYLRFARMLAGGGEFNGQRLVSPKTLRLMTANHLPGGKDLGSMSISLFSEATYQGVGFGLGLAMTLDPARTMLPETAGNFYWGGAAGTYFWVDPKEDLIVVFMTQLLGYGPDLRRGLKTLVYSALTD